MSSRIAVYAGSFDPVTLGHEDIVRRGARLFDRLVVGIGVNPEKKPLFEPAERQELMATIFSDLPNVQIECFAGLTVDFARQHAASVMLRGVRTVSDIEAEFTMALANRTLAPDVETVFLMAADRYSHISSTLIKQIAQMGGRGTQQQLRQFVPTAVIEPLLSKVS
jgi:pantetheine-phosphate adenylyltransferase